MAIKHLDLYVPDLVGIVDIATSPEWRNWCEGVGEAIAQLAHAEGASVQGTGQYNNSWRGGAELETSVAGVEMTKTGAYTLPAGIPFFAAVAKNMDWTSAFVEYGAKPNNKRTPNPTPRQRGGHVKRFAPKHVLLHAFERVVGALMA